MKIRAATVSDGETLSSLAIYAWMASYGREGMSHTMASYVMSEYSPARYRARLLRKGELIWVVEHKHRLVGFCEVLLKTSHAATRATTRLGACYLHEQFQDDPIREELLRHAIQELRKYQIDALWLSVWRKEEAAMQWYLERGFQEVGEFFLEIDGAHYKHAILDNSAH